jgi:hypothetical protein
MKELLNRAIELSRRHIFLWGPCSVAGILTLAMGRLQKVEIRRLLEFLTTQHSVLGGTVHSTDLAQAQHRAMMIIYPLDFLKEFLEVCLFVAALVTTKNMVQMLIEERRPSMIAAVRDALPQFGEALLFSLKYFGLLAVLGGAFLVLGNSPLIPERFFHDEPALSMALFYISSLAVEACLAWLLMPTAIRLLRPPGYPTVSAKERKVGTILAVITSAGSFALEYLVAKAEPRTIFDNPWDGYAIAIVNTVIINTLQVLLFIALALLAIQGLGEKLHLEAGPEAS